MWGRYIHELIRTVSAQLWVDIVNGCFGQSNNDFQRGTSWRKPWRQSRQEIPAQYWQKSILMKILPGNPSRSLDEKFWRGPWRESWWEIPAEVSTDLAQNLGGKTQQESWRKSWRASVKWKSWWEIPPGILTEILARNHCGNLNGNPGRGFSENFSGKFWPESWRKSWSVSCWKSRPHRYFQMLLTANFPLPIATSNLFPCPYSPTLRFLYNLWPLFVPTLINPTSNDPGKKGSNFFCCSAIRFPHIEMFSFLRREYINLQKGS